MLLPIILIGFALRLLLLDRFPFREDEAVYSYWALHAWHEDPLFLDVWPDKPPIFIWLLSGAFQLFGSTAASARLLNIIFSTLTIPLIAAVTRRVSAPRSAAPHLAAMTMALNPFAISFSATAFTDPLLVFCGLMAFYFTLSHRAFWAGAWLAAAIMTKQQGVFYVPLVVGTAWLRRPQGVLPQDERNQPTIIKFLIGFALVAAPILYWDSLRWAVAPSPWDLSVRNYGALRLLPPHEWFGSAQRWLDLLWYLAASAWTWLGLGAIVLWRVGRAQATSRPMLLVLMWCIGFVILHIVSTIQPWDRYLLPLVPFFALLAGLAVAGTTRNVRINQAIALLWIVLLIGPALRSAVGGYPVGGDHGAYTGLDEAIAWIEDAWVDDAWVDEQTDGRVILYHRALGWHYRFYLFEQIRRGRVELRWFPHGTYLADNATKSPHRRRVVIEPAWSPVRDLSQQARTRGLMVESKEQAGSFHVLTLSSASRRGCDWCLCRPPNGWIVDAREWFNLRD